MTSPQVTAKIIYSKPGTQPPVYLAGTFSEPEWDPIELEYTTEGEEHQFYKEVQVQENEQYQYKFRIGSGDWWVLNEDAPTVTDDIGNRNNLLIVPRDDHSTHAEASDKDESSTTKPQDEVPIPKLVVEKTDAELAHGEDFGPDASSGQKVAHELRAQDAKPDVTIIKPETATTDHLESAAQEQEISSAEYNDTDEESADTAAEVADAAANIDRESTPALVSDEEAGRIGYRRLSNTPIPQVALTAAEVADSAAIIDSGTTDTSRTPKTLENGVKTNPVTEPFTPREEENDEEEAPRLPHELLEDRGEHLHGNDTPVEDQAPLLAHEQPESPIQQEFTPESSYQGDLTPDSPQKSVIYDDDQDFDDPNLEEFPSDRPSILAHVRSTESRLTADPVDVDFKISSPASTSRRSSESIPALEIQPSPSPSLHIIAEENHEPHEDFALPSSSSTALETVEPEVIDVRGTSDGNIVVRPLDPQNGKLEVQDAQSVVKTSEDESLNSVNNGVSKVADLPGPGDRNVAVDGAGADAFPAETHADYAVRDEDYAVLEGAIGRKNSSRNKGTGTSIEPQSASTGLRDTVHNMEETTKAKQDKATIGGSGGKANGESTTVRKRKTTTERPVTPRNVETPLNKGQAHSFFQHMWKTVFVEWIGGFIARVFGRKRRA